MPQPRIRTALLATAASLALGACGHSGSIDCKDSPQSVDRGRASGIALPADFPADIHLPTTDFIVASLHQDIEFDEHSPEDPEQLANEFNAMLPTHGWSGAMMPAPGGPNAWRGNFRKGCRGLDVRIGPGGDAGGARLLIHGGAGLYPGCIGHEGEKTPDFDGDVTMSGRLPADALVPGSAVPSAPPTQHFSMELRSRKPLGELFEEFGAAMRTACWRDAFPNPTPERYRGLENFVKGDRFVGFDFSTDGADTRIVVTLMSTNPKK